MTSARLATGIAVVLAVSQAATSPCHAQTIGGASTGPIEISGVSDSRCRLEIGELPDSLSAGGPAGGPATISVPVQIECNTPFILYGGAALGRFILSPPPGSSAPPQEIGYEIVWPEMSDANGVPIAANFSGTGEDWQRGLSAASGPTRELQRGLMTIRVRAEAGSTRELMPDQFTIQIEPN